MAKKPKVVHRTVILNGTKVWLTCMTLLFSYGGTSVWWAATQTKAVSDIGKAVIEIKDDLKTKADVAAVIEIKNDLKEHLRGR